MEKYISKAIFSNENKNYYNFGLYRVFIIYGLMSTEQAVSKCVCSLPHLVVSFQLLYYVFPGFCIVIHPVVSELPDVPNDPFNVTWQVGNAD